MYYDYMVSNIEIICEINLDEKRKVEAERSSSDPVPYKQGRTENLTSLTS